MLLRVRVSVVDRPGALLAVAKVLADIGGNIADIAVLATGDHRAVDDLVVELPDDDIDAMTTAMIAAGAEVLDVRRTVRLSGQRPDLDLLARVASQPSEMLATLVSLMPPIYSADWAAAVAVADPSNAIRTSPGAPRLLPTGLPMPIGPLPRRASIDTVTGAKWETVGVPCGEHVLYLGRTDGPTYLQVELLQLRRIVELSLALAAAAGAADS